MIYFIDEEDWKLTSYKNELEQRKYKVTFITNANHAYDLFSEKEIDIKDVELVIIDVMLSVDPFIEHNIFNSSETKGYLLTGVVLLDKLCEVVGDIFPKKAIFFSSADTVSLRNVIEKSCEKNGIIFLEKAKYKNSFEFGKIIQSHIESIG